MKNIFLILFGGLLTICFNLNASAEVAYEAWARIYDGPANGPDGTVAIAVDDSGNVLVAGPSWGGVSAEDYTLIKYSADGDMIWVTFYNGPGDSTDVPAALVLDDSGNAYVTGRSWGSSGNFDYATVKYAPNGDTLWTRRYNGPSDSTDVATAIDVDDSGNVYVTGYSWGAGTTEDYTTIKYNSMGDTVWVRQYAGAGTSSDVAVDIEVHQSGNVYVTGNSLSAYTTLKYTPTGDTEWVRRYEEGNVARDLAVDQDGNVGITGNVGGIDYGTILYSSAGDSLWAKAYNFFGSVDEPARVVFDTSGNVFVTGYSVGFTFADYATLKYTPAGDTGWVRRYDGPEAGEDDWDAARALALDLAGNVYVTGISDSAGHIVDPLTIKYSPSGDAIWIWRYMSPDNSSAAPYGLAVDESGNTYVTGTQGGNSLTIKYSPCLDGSPVAGDANADSSHTLADVISTVNYIFNKTGCSPQPLCWLSNLLCRGDWDGSTTVTLSDVIRAVNYIFGKPGGPWNAVQRTGCCGLPL